MYQAGRLTRRIKELQHVSSIVMALRGELSYGRQSLPEILCTIAEKADEPFSAFLNHIVEELIRFSGSSFQDIFARNVDQELEETSLLLEDKEDLKVLGQYLGYLDVQMQEQMIDHYLQKLKMKIDCASAVLEGKRNLYRMAGVMGGMFLAVLFL